MEEKLREKLFEGMGWTIPLVYRFFLFVVPLSEYLKNNAAKGRGMNRLPMSDTQVMEGAMTFCIRGAGRVYIVDESSNSTVFEWIHNKGVVFPCKDKRNAKAEEGK